LDLSEIFSEAVTEEGDRLMKDLTSVPNPQGEQEWKTSKNEFSDSECPNLNHGDKGSLQNCKAFCLEEPGCNAFNYDSTSTHCVLRGCELPVVPPTTDVSGTFDGYWTEATVVLSLTAGAAEHQGDTLGEFVEAGEHEERPFYRQRDTEGSKPQYLYFEDNCWQVSETLGNRNDYIKNCQDTQLPPTKNWEYVGDGGWSDDDTSLTLEFTTLSPICQLVRVAGEGEVVEKQGSSLGDYRLEEGRWSEGRPVFKKINGETRFLIVGEGSSSWYIQTSTTATGGWISSGRATNSPSSPEAGPSVRREVTRWRYFGGGKWNEGDISVTCV